MNTRFFKIIDNEYPGIVGDIIAFFPGQKHGMTFYIRIDGVSAWESAMPNGERGFWRLDEMTPDFVVELTEAEVFNYCPAAVIPPVSVSN